LCEAMAELGGKMQMISSLLPTLLVLQRFCRIRARLNL
jgi:hypothetical protein